MATAALFLDKAHFLFPSPIRDQDEGPSSPSRPRSATWASSEGGAFSRISAARCSEAAAGIPLRGYRRAGKNVGPVVQCP